MSLNFVHFFQCKLKPAMSVLQVNVLKWLMVQLVSSLRCLDILVVISTGQIFPYHFQRRTPNYISSINFDLPLDRNYKVHISQATIRVWWPYNHIQRGRWSRITRTLNHTQELMCELNYVNPLQLLRCLAQYLCIGRRSSVWRKTD